MRLVHEARIADDRRGGLDDGVLQPCPGHEADKEVGSKVLDLADEDIAEHEIQDEQEEERAGDSPQHPHRGAPVAGGLVAPYEYDEHVPGVPQGAAVFRPRHAEEMRRQSCASRVAGGAAPAASPRCGRLAQASPMWRKLAK